MKPLSGSVSDRIPRVWGQLVTPYFSVEFSNTRCFLGDPGVKTINQRGGHFLHLENAFPPPRPGTETIRSQSGPDQREDNNRDIEHEENDETMTHLVK